MGLIRRHAASPAKHAPEYLPKRAPRQPRANCPRPPTTGPIAIKRLLRVAPRPSSGQPELLSESPEVVDLRENSRHAARKYSPVFQMPSLLLDLDAEDSPFVRPFDVEKDGLQQRLKWASEPLLDELRDQASLHRRALNDEAKAMSEAASRSLGPRAISDHDIFKVTLLGGLAFSQRFHTGLRTHGIPQSVLDRGSSEVVPFMFHRQRLAAQRLNESSPIDQHEYDTPKLTPFEDEVHECECPADLRKVFLRIINPTSANHVGSNALDLIHKRCVELYPKDDLTRSCDYPATSECLDLLGFVNNAMICLGSNGHPFHPGLALFGLQVASRHGLMAPTLQYLQIIKSLDLFDEPTQEQAALSLQVARNILVALETADVVAIGIRQQLLGLLFGFDPGQKEVQPSFLGLNTDLDRVEDPEGHQVRVQLLGQLGALRILWRFGKGADKAALMDAFHRFAKLTFGVKDLKFTTTKDDIENDIALDLQTMNALDADLIRNGMDSGASNTPAPNVTELLSSEKILAAFKEKHIGDALGRFQELVRS